jgi:hypothetical protein
MNGKVGHFTGVVDSINVKGAGPNSAQVLVALRDERGEKKALVVLSDSEPQVFAGMVSLLTLAFESGLTVDAWFEPAKPTDKLTELEIRRGR